MANIISSLHCASIDMVYIKDRKPYLAISTGLVNHILFEDSLSYLEKLYYLLTDFYSNMNQSKSVRSTEKSAKEWATLLSCSEEWIFRMQKKLEKLNYFQIIREKDEDNQNEKNIITPTLPDHIFYELAHENNRFNPEKIRSLEETRADYKRSFLDDSKMFIMFNLKMIKLLLSDYKLTSLQKLIWIYFFSRSHKSYIDNYGDGTRNFITTYKEIAAAFSCKENTVSTAINNLFQLGYISKKQFRVKDQGKLGRRKKKSCWEIAALFPQEKIDLLFKQPDRQNLAALSLEDLKLYGIRQPISTQENSYLVDYHDRSAIYHETAQYNNKNNILNIKNNVLDLSQKTKKSNASSQRSNSVFSEKQLLVSNDELALGLDIAARFEAETFLKPEENLANLEEVIKEVDGTFTTEEHWLVTKTAFTLHQKLQTAVLAQYGVEYDDGVVTKLKEQLFTMAEERLISLWESFSDAPDQAEQEEFLIRKSWLLRLLPNCSLKLKNNHSIQYAPIIKDPSLCLTIPDLPGDKADKAKKFAKKLLTKKLAKGYSAGLSIDDLAKELIYHAANWIPAKLNCKTREEQIDAALSFAWKAVEQGIWQCPYRLLNMQIQQRELESIRWKSL